MILLQRTTYDSKNSHRITASCCAYKRLRKRFQFVSFSWANRSNEHERRTYLHHFNNKCDFTESKTFNRRKFNFIRIFQLLVLSVSMDLHETAVAGAVADAADFNSSLPQNPSDMKL